MAWRDGADRFITWVRESLRSLRPVPRDDGHDIDRQTRPLISPRALAASLATALAALAVYAIAKHPPFAAIGSGEVGLRLNQLTGDTTEFGEGSVFVVPGVHRLRRLSLREQVYRPAQGEGAAPFQSVEGLSIGVDVTVRYALDRKRIGALAASLPEDIGGEIVEPRVLGVIYKAFARYTVREVFSTKRAEIQQMIEQELRPLLDADGVTLRAVTLGRIALPAEYRAGLERLLAEELASEKMRYTLELKEKLVKQSELEASADKARRDKAAEAAGNETVIAAKAQAEAMKHVLPFKQRQIEQRKLEAEAEKISRMKIAEANAEARKIEAGGEAESRRKLAEAEAYRLEVTGKATNAQLARDGAVISQHPLLIQKAMADKLSDKISVIIAPTPTDGAFLGSAVIGAVQRTRNAPARAEAQRAEGAQEPQ